MAEMPKHRVFPMNHGKNSVLARATLDAEHILTRHPSREKPPPETAVQVYGAEQPATVRAPATEHGIE